MKGQIMNHGTLRIWKRKTAWLALIPVVAVVCLAVMPQSQSNQANVNSMCKWAFIEGSWLATVTIPDPEGGPPQLFPSPLSFSAGGALVCSDPSPFPNMTTAYHGTWARKGPRTFVFTMTGYQYDATWPAAYKLWRGMIKETVKIERDGDAYSGEGTVTWYDPDGNQYGPYPDSTYAVRIEAE